jgi:hypothetical protein
VVQSKISKNLAGSTAKPRPSGVFALCPGFSIGLGRRKKLPPRPGVGWGGSESLQFFRLVHSLNGNIRVRQFVTHRREEMSVLFPVGNNFFCRVSF